MKIYRNFANLSGRFTACIGFFDGVHLGHRFLLDHLRGEAERSGTASAAITFANHPRQLVEPGYRLQLIDTLDERLRKLDATGLDACFLLDFTEEVRRMTAQSFLRDVVARQLHVVRLLIGYDHRFGHNRAEGFDDYVRYGRDCGIEVVQEPVYELPAEGCTSLHCSSSAVRQALLGGDVERAGTLLGQPFSLEGIVVAGHQLGRRLGFPTANLLPPSGKLIPLRGVYAAWAILQDGRRLPAMLNIGHRPTVESGDTATTLEVHVIGFEGNLYGQTIRLSLQHRLRDERQMASLDALSQQLRRDREATLRVLGI